MGQFILQGKLKITATMTLLTGLHIGGTDEFAPIGALDNTIIRDPLSKQPIIPGSSVKGKLRSLLRRNTGKLKLDEEDERIRRMFGYAGDKEAYPARLQFYDLRMTEESVNELKNLDTDTYLGEIKSENAIDSLTGAANPRQMERVPAGARFAFELVYDVADWDEALDDMELLADGLNLLQWDYLGGSGTRGYGRVSFSEFDIKSYTGLMEKADSDIMEMIKESLQKVIR